MKRGVVYLGELVANASEIKSYHYAKMYQCVAANNGNRSEEK
jgi:hypothetical protein